ncbi:DUF3846 domain-containing protein [Bacillus thuringiensis]|uniref:DUF3846 domain-containing protein n=1 Tax=Bacillus thuringiensis TaxID=1428 RepID=UPI003335ECD1
MGKIEVLEVAVGMPLIKREIDANLESYQSIVAGLIEKVSVTEDIDLYANEERNLLELDKNILLMYQGKPYQFVKDNVFFASFDEKGKIASLTNEHIQEIKNRIALAFLTTGEQVYTVNIS